MAGDEPVTRRANAWGLGVGAVTGGVVGGLVEAFDGGPLMLNVAVWAGVMLGFFTAREVVASRNQQQDR